MTGPEHFQKADELVAIKAVSREERRANLAAAQVHATLALAAATAISRAGDMPVPDCDAWTAIAAYGPGGFGPEPGAEQ